MFATTTKPKNVNWSLEKALELSGVTSVEWKLYQRQGSEVTVDEIEQRIKYLETKFNNRCARYRNSIVTYLKDELTRRQQN
jgi:hypothetical protein